jgi:hypothetical protein
MQEGDILPLFISPILIKNRPFDVKTKVSMKDTISRGNILDDLRRTALLSELNWVILGSVEARSLG